MWHQILGGRVQQLEDHVNRVLIARLIVIFSANVNCELVAKRSFKYSEFEHKGVKKLPH